MERNPNQVVKWYEVHDSILDTNIMFDTEIMKLFSFDRHESSKSFFFVILKSWQYY